MLEDIQHCLFMKKSIMNLSLLSYISSGGLPIPVQRMRKDRNRQIE
ncbi:hypothetical protein QSI_0131 [Clostridioides difficile P28]|nr:hypothetical protein QSI_0131 [Clostridioides difficile P28]